MRSRRRQTPLPTALRRSFHHDAHHRWTLTSPAQHLLDQTRERSHCRSFLWQEITHANQHMMQGWSPSCGCDDARFVWMPCAFLAPRVAPPPLPSLHVPPAAAFVLPSPWQVCPLVNAAFIEDTDLFMFLTSHRIDAAPLLARLARNGQSAGTHHTVFRHGCWEAWSEASDTGRCLGQCRARVQLQLDDARHDVNCDGRTDPRGAPHAHIHQMTPCTVGTRDDAYFISLIVPPARAGARGTPHASFTADTCWIDADTVSQYHLACFTDAFDVPLFVNESTPAALTRPRPICGRFFTNMDHVA